MSTFRHLTLLAFALLLFGVALLRVDAASNIKFTSVASSAVNCTKFTDNKTCEHSATECAWCDVPGRPSAGTCYNKNVQSCCVAAGQFKAFGVCNKSTEVCATWGPGDPPLIMDCCPKKKQGLCHTECYDTNTHFCCGLFDSPAESFQVCEKGAKCCMGESWGDFWCCAAGKKCVKGTVGGCE